MALIAELKRRNVIRMAGLYLVGAWLLVQVASTLFPAFGVPGWALRALVIVLALGFVPALAFSWVYELTPTGLKAVLSAPTGLPAQLAVAARVAASNAWSGGPSAASRVALASSGAR